MQPGDLVEHVRDEDGSTLAETGWMVICRFGDTQIGLSAGYERWLCRHIATDQLYPTCVDPMDGCDGEEDEGE